MKVIELYSGIGGMHMALKASGVEGEVVASIDINPVANTIYKHNFNQVNLMHRNIEGLSPKFVNKFGGDTILMSPPCQPFTRNGLQADVKDERTNSFKHLLTILPELKIGKILIENVKGFEKSVMRDLLIQTLDKCGFIYQEFILSPHQLGVPNSRHRYYCIAKKSPDHFGFEQSALLESIPLEESLSADCFQIGKILEDNLDPDKYYLSDKMLERHANVLDICYGNSTKSCCFTKAYGRYLEGTGSVFCPKTDDYLGEIFKRVEDLQEDKLGLLKTLELRFFTPKEVCRLMSFPECFEFPPGVTEKQKYCVLGNSINVKVVSELIKLLK